MSTLRLRRDDLAWSDAGGETVLLDLESSTYFTVRGTGSYLISRLADGVSEESLVESLVAHYDVDLDTAKSDVAEFLKQLDEHHMLESAD